ncbi:pentapeptide repeat-containing protein [Kocuria sabuli]|uniref:pentapeptide repeat-containing protein n=1 Tax=Kocuria sabuli TaxID=3071448 RepID=UPI0034D5545B
MWALPQVILAVPVVVNSVGPEWWSQLTQPQATLLASLAVLSSALVAFAAALLTHRRERQAARQERYTTIAEQLAHKSETVRLAGIYALEALANEWQQARQGGQRDVGVELLCAYLRSPRHKGGDKEARSAVATILRLHSNVWTKKMGLEYRLVRQFLFRFINETRVMQAPWPSDIINLEGADLRNARFTNADFRKARLVDADLTEAYLMASDLRGADLSNACLKGAFLWRANLRGTDLSNADLGTPGLDEVLFYAPPHLKNVSQEPSVKWDGTTVWPKDFNIQHAISRQADRTLVSPSSQNSQ